MDALTVVTVGALRWDLGIEYAICAVADARGRGTALRYDIIGAGPERDRAIFTMFDLTVDDVVRVLEPGRTVLNDIACADVFLWPHLCGSTSTALRVAQASGTRVVVTARTPAAEGVSAVVPLRDPTAMADALIDAARVPRASRPLPDRDAAAVAAIIREATCGSS